MATTLNSLIEGSEFDTDYRNLLWAVDVLSGDDPQSDRIADHGMVDADARKHILPPPAVYADRALPKEELYKKYSLLDLPMRLMQVVNESNIDPIRKGVIKREIRVAAMRMRVLHESGDDHCSPKIPFDELWRIITGDEPPMLSSLRGEILALRDHISGLLGSLDVHVTNPRTLKQHMQEWEHAQRCFGIEHVDEIKRMLRESVEDFFGQFCDFASSIPALEPFVRQLSIDRYEISVLPDMTFDAGLSYIGGDVDGEPALAAHFEWNAGRPAPAVDIRYIGIHECVHAINAQLMDLQRRAGRLGPEASLLTMSSCRAVNEEGLAQTMLEILHGGITGVVETHGPEMGIILLQDQLQDIARLAAAIGWNIEFKDLEPAARRECLRDFIENDLLQTAHIGHKYAGEKKRFWRELTGGQMYAPAYYLGSRIYRDALTKHSAQHVLAVGTHSEGLVDIQAFQQKLGR